MALMDGLKKDLNLSLPLPDRSKWLVNDKEDDYWPEEDGYTVPHPIGYPEITPKIFQRFFRKLDFTVLDPKPEFYIVKNPSGAPSDKYIIPSPWRHPELDWLPNLGNQLFIFAASASLAFTGGDNYHVALDTLYFHNFAQVFDVSQFEVKKDIDHTFAFPNYNCCAYTPAYAAALRNEELKKANVNIALPGYLQAWKFFHPFMLEEFRRLIKFRTVTRNKADALTKGIVRNLAKQGVIQEQDVVTVGIHVRRGDIVEVQEHIDMGHLPATMDYFERAMDFFKSKFTNVAFVLISNDMKWCKENFAGHNDVGFVEYEGDFSQPERAGIEMCIMAYCDHMIMSVGTYSWWGAYLRKVVSRDPKESIVTFFKDWPRKGSPQDINLRWEDYFLPEWIPL